jgi:hypothetical protein
VTRDPGKVGEAGDWLPATWVALCVIRAGVKVEVAVVPPPVFSESAQEYEKNEDRGRKHRKHKDSGS